MALEDDQGLGLVTEPPGSEPLTPATELGGLNLATPAPQAPQASSSGREPSPLLVALDQFGAGLSGREAQIPKLQAMEREKRRQNLQDMQSRLEITKEVTRQAQSLPEGQRAKYLEAVQGQYADPDLKNMLKFAGQAPDVLHGYEEAVKNDPLIRNLAAQGKVTEFMQTEAGQKYVRERQYPAFAKEWSMKTPELVNWTKENRPEVYEKALKDGKLTTTELRDILDNAPVNLKPTPQSTAYFLTPDGQKRLSGVIGIPVLTDEIESKKLEKDETQGDTTLLKHLKELEEAEGSLKNGGGDDAQRRIDTIKKKIMAETEGTKQSDALKDMRNNIVLKTAKLKERDPSYQPPAHEQYILDEFAKTDSIERLRRDILSGAGAGTTTPASGGKGPSLEEFLKKARAANPGVSDEALTSEWKRKYGGK